MSGIGWKSSRRVAEPRRGRHGSSEERRAAARFLSPGAQRARRSPRMRESIEGGVKKQTAVREGYQAVTPVHAVRRFRG
jgi:hypothetical protein